MFSNVVCEYKRSRWRRPRVETVAPVSLGRRTLRAVFSGSPRVRGEADWYRTVVVSTRRCCGRATGEDVATCSSRPRASLSSLE